MVRVDTTEVKPEYNQDPESLQSGDDLIGHHSHCAKCLGQIYAPILEGIWYHKGGVRYNDNHEPIPADTFTQLFLMYRHSGNGTRLKIGKYDDKESKACPCYLKWYQLLRKNIQEGFYDEEDRCYYDSNGITLCKSDQMDLHTYDVSDPFYPKKQMYHCTECLKILVKKKIIKIIQYTGKSKSDLWNRIEWLKN